MSWIITKDYRQIDDPKKIHEIIQAASGKQYNHEVASRLKSVGSNLRSSNKTFI